MTTKPTPGFYWARRKDDRTLTVVEAYEFGGELSFNLLGNPTVMDVAELTNYFELLGRIDEPK